MPVPMPVSLPRVSVDSEGELYASFAHSNMHLRPIKAGPSLRACLSQSAGFICIVSRVAAADPVEDEEEHGCSWMLYV